VPQPGDVTRLLRAYEAGDRLAFDQLVPLVYEEMRRVARAQIHRGAGPAVFETTSLVHEAYLKLAEAEQLSAADRRHLMAIAASAMRQVLVDRARARLTAKRGGGRAPIPLHEIDVAAEPAPEYLLDLDRALDVLRRRDERLAKVVECRFFAGLSDEDTADALGLSLRTAQRDWMRARAWLKAELGSSPPGA